MENNSQECKISSIKCGDVLATTTHNRFIRFGTRSKFTHVALAVSQDEIFEATIIGSKGHKKKSKIHVDKLDNFLNRSIDLARKTGKSPAVIYHYKRPLVLNENMRVELAQSCQKKAMTSMEYGILRATLSALMNPTTMLIVICAIYVSGKLYFNGLKNIGTILVTPLLNPYWYVAILTAFIIALLFNKPYGAINKSLTPGKCKALNLIKTFLRENVRVEFCSQSISDIDRDISASFSKYINPINFFRIDQNTHPRLHEYLCWHREPAPVDVIKACDKACKQDGWVKVEILDSDIEAYLAKLK